MNRATGWGGCCGTESAHIKALTEALKGEKAPLINETPRRVLTSERRFYEIRLDGALGIVGERVNPTGKKKLQAELRAGSLSLALEMAKEQDERGAAVLDVNMGVSGIDEKAMMKEAVEELTSTVDTPLCIDSSYPEVIEAALRIYPGRALINSISLESEKCDRLLAIAKKYGAMFVLLPLSDEGLPKDQEEKKENIRRISEKAFALGMTKEDIVVDGLVATVGAEPEAAKNVLATIRYCKEELELATICGLSNISFGLPERQFLNTAFLTLAIGSGLTLAIANPSQDLLLNIASAADLLLHKDGSAESYISRMALLTGTEEPAQTKESKAETKDPAEVVFHDVISGDEKKIAKDVEELLKTGKTAGEIIDSILIPGINEVGDKYEKKIYFLPQLISSANAMKAALDLLEPMLGGASDAAAPGTIVIATVEGDIHDIGKNLVALMLKNYGYRVIDLGKDVTAESILEAAVREKADVIGLSALMTTTMVRMKEVVALAKEKQYEGKIIIGGACITQEYADEIGADGYAADAAGTVKLVERLLA